MIPGIIAGAWRKRDPYWPSVVLAMHMDDTGLTDKKGHSVTLSGNAARSSTQSKFGGYSAAFDGTGDYLSFADSNDWYFGSGDFTIEAFIWPTNLSADREWIAQRNTADANNFWFVRLQTNGKLRAYSKSGGTVITDVLSTGTVSTGAFTHVAVVRNSGSVTVAIGGTFGTAVTTNSSSAWANVGYSLYIGTGDNSATPAWNGYIDEIRVTKGVAKWTSNFTPPSEAYPDA